MEQSPSGEANSHSASQKIPRLVWNPKVHYSVHKIPQLYSDLTDESSLHPQTPISLKFILILLQVSQVVSSVQGSQPKSRMHFTSLPCMPDSQPISFSIMW